MKYINIPQENKIKIQINKLNCPFKLCSKHTDTYTYPIYISKKIIEKAVLQEKANRNYKHTRKMCTHLCHFTHIVHTHRVVPLEARVWVCGPGWCQSLGPQSRHCRSLVAGQGDTCGRRAAHGAQQLLASSPPAPIRTHKNAERELIS